MSVGAREAAYKALISFRKNAVWSDAALSAAITSAGLDARDAALASQICYGVIQNRALCDYYVAKFCSTKLAKLEPQVLDILRLSAYQILFLDKIPNSAAVNEGVKLTKKHANARASGLVNAVLRKLSDASDNLPEIEADDMVSRMAIKYSHPRELCAELCRVLGEESAEKLLAANNHEVPIYAHVNTLKSTAAEVESALEAAEIRDVRHAWVPGCFELSGTGSIVNLPLVSSGQIYVQDPAAFAAVAAAAPEPGMTVIDACAAPGGKSFAAALLMQNTGAIHAFDISAKKLGRIEDGAKRLGIDIITAAQADSREKLPLEYASADLVIADVPCSGYGVIRKKPEIRYKPLSETENLPQIQLAILRNLANYVRPGGKLLYSTCTILPRENEEVVNEFLRSSNEFAIEPFSIPGLLDAGEGRVTLLPHIHGTDGFFISVLRRLT